jgi:hypothetical protein
MGNEVVKGKDTLPSKEMLENIDLLLALPAIEEADHWQSIEDIDLEEADAISESEKNHE